MTGQRVSLYRTALGEVVLGDSLDVLRSLNAESVDLVLTSPPFALLREKTYGNADQAGYVDWLCQFAPLVHRVLKPTGSYVIDLGGAYQRGKPACGRFRISARGGVFLAQPEQAAFPYRVGQQAQNQGQGYRQHRLVAQQDGMAQC